MNYLKPEIIIPDTSPLIHLAAAGHLHLLNAVGDVVLVDMVVHEATDNKDKPFAKEIGRWIKDHNKDKKDESSITYATTENW